MKNQDKRLLFTWLRRFFMILFLGIIIYVAVEVKMEPSKFSAEYIKTMIPENKLLAAIFLIILYIIKGISMFFPSSVLNILSGITFDLPYSFIVSVLGISFEFCILYWIGRYLGADVLENLKSKSKKTEIFSQMNTENAIFVSFFVRIIGLVSYDVGSIYLGAMKIDFFKFYLGSILGASINIILSTLIGEYIFNLFDWRLWVVVVLRIIIAILSFVFNVKIRKAKRNLRRHEWQKQN